LVEFFKNLLQRLKEEFSSWQGVAAAVFDVLLVALGLYLLFLFLKKHNCSRLIKFFLIALFVFTVLGSELLGLTMLGRIVKEGLVVVVLAVVLLFPQEIRRKLWQISSPAADAAIFTTGYDCSDDELRATINEIVRAVQNMAKKDVGALIVIAPQGAPNNVLESGTKLDAILTGPLLESIFNTKSPLHDGAVFARGNRVIAAGCFLPLTQSASLDKELGTRHRAAVGISETNNVLAIIVSEETGIISIATNGELSRYYDSVMLHDKLEQVYGLKAVLGGKKLRKRK